MPCHILNLLVFGLAAIVVAFITLVTMALCLGQPLEDVPGSAWFVPIIGKIAVLLAVGIATFRFTAKSLARPS